MTIQAGNARRGWVKRRTAMEAAFWDRIDQSQPDACWPWPGAHQTPPPGAARLPYGILQIRGRRVFAHRRAVELVTGTPIPTGMVVMHACDNPPCVNPAHLRIGTMADNSADMVAKGRSARGNVTGGRLTADQRADVRARLAAGERVRPIARDYGLSMGAIYAIRQGVSWRSDRIPSPEPAPAAGAPAETVSPRGLARRSDRSGRPPVPESVTPPPLA